MDTKGTFTEYRDGTVAEYQANSFKFSSRSLHTYLSHDRKWDNTSQVEVSYRGFASKIDRFDTIRTKVINYLTINVLIEPNVDFGITNIRLDYPSNINGNTPCCDIIRDENKRIVNSYLLGFFGFGTFYEPYNTHSKNRKDITNGCEMDQIFMNLAKHMYDQTDIMEEFRVNETWMRFVSDFKTYCNNELRNDLTTEIRNMNDIGKRPSYIKTGCKCTCRD